MRVASGSPSIPKAEARAQAQAQGNKPVTPPKPHRLASFLPGEKASLRKILDTPLPGEKDVVGQCRDGRDVIRTYGRQAGLQRVDIQGEGLPREERVRTFSVLDAEPGVVTPRGRVHSVETRKQGLPGAEGNAPAVHTFHFTNGLSQTVAESERGEIFWLGLADRPMR